MEWRTFCTGKTINYSQINVFSGKFSRYKKDQRERGEGGREREEEDVRYTIADRIIGADDIDERCQQWKDVSVGGRREVIDPTVLITNRL